MLYRVIDEHLETFLDAAAQHAGGHRLPKFVEQEFRDFLTCGVLAHGFARLPCGDCAFERLVPFPCKGRGFCPSCGGRRMTEGAARLVDGILPHVPVRQWVLSLPHRLRYLIAWDHELCRAVLAIYVRGARRAAVPGGAALEHLAGRVGRARERARSLRRHSAAHLPAGLSGNPPQLAIVIDLFFPLR